MVTIFSLFHTHMHTQVHPRTHTHIHAHTLQLPFLFFFLSFYSIVMVSAVEQRKSSHTYKYIPSRPEPPSLPASRSSQHQAGLPVFCSNFSPSIHFLPDNVSILMPLIWPLQGTVWRILRKPGIRLPYDPATPLLGMFPATSSKEKDACFLDNPQAWGYCGESLQRVEKRENE